MSTHNLLKASIAFLLFALAALPARAQSTAPSVRSGAPMFHTGLHAPDIEPLLRGFVVQGVQTLVFAGCFLALDDDDTCVDIASKARDGVAGIGEK